jgi:topoisomerase-4 subunit B
MDTRGLAPKGVKVIAEDLWGRACFTLSARIVRTQFHGQTKEKLTTRHAARLLELCVRDAFELWLNEHPEDGKKIVELAIEQAMARLSKGKKVERKKSSGIATLPGKLVDCASGDITRNELFLVEGDSAGGSAKEARDKEIQAVLPLRGKVLNVAGATRDKINANQQIADLVQALGCGTRDRYREDDLRYDKIILMTDADVDGAHIASLLVTFFFQEMPKLIDDGHLYLAMPPLYRISSGPKVLYAMNDLHKDELMGTEFKGKKPDITRFKGLGEMPYQHLRETTMDKKTRRLLQVRVLQDRDDTKDSVDRLMGTKPEARFAFIQENAAFVSDLDI